MNNDLLLVKIITLLYLELIQPNEEISVELTRPILEELQLPELVVGIDPEKEKIVALRSTAFYLMEQQKEAPIELADLLQRLRVDCKFDDRLYDSFQQGLSAQRDEKQMKRTIVSLRKAINNYNSDKESAKLLREASNEFNFRREKIKNPKTFFADLVSKLEKYSSTETKSDPAIIANCSTDDPESMDRAYDEMCQSGQARMITGWQAVNDMTQGGFGRAEQWVLGALQHQYKTGFTLSLTKQFAIYNKPLLKDPNKKPLIMRISFEDTLNANIKFLYKNIVFNETGVLPDDAYISDKKNIKEIRDYVMEKTSVQGYTIKLYQVNPSEWGYKDLQNLVMEEEANGYEVHVCIVDYLSVMSLRGCDVETAGHALRDLYKRTRSFFVARNILFITPHQLSTDAKQLIRDGRNDFVKQLEGRGYYAGSKQIDQVVDGEIFVHLEKMNGSTYLTMYRGKQRNVEAIPDSRKYVILPFPPRGPIPDDLGKPRIDVKKMGGAPVGSGGEEIPFFEID